MQVIDAILQFSGDIGGFLWGPWTFFVLMGAGILFTLWTRFTQFRALTHGVAVVRGKYDNPDDPGAINHFQALSAALSATVGLGNIGGVALAVGAGGPGAIFWMWIIGFLGMAIKTVEVSLSMLYRDTHDSDDPHGGAMWVIDRTLGARGGVWKALAKILGVTFCITLIISTITGGNMFQSWNVAALTDTYFGVEPLVTGILLAVIVGLVIVGGIKRIGTVAGRLVPLMCVLYLVAGLSVLAVHVADIPVMLMQIVTSAFSSEDAGGAFLGGSAGWAFSTGLRRALFSNEAGQGSAPIAHSAARTDEPVREGIVAGLEPFIDTICICTLTALVIMLTGTWNRDPLVRFSTPPAITEVHAFGDSPLPAGAMIDAGTAVHLNVSPTSPSAAERLRGTVTTGDDGAAVIAWHDYSGASAPAPTSLDVFRVDQDTKETLQVATLPAAPVSSRAERDGTPLWGLLTAPQPVVIDNDDEYKWRGLGDVFLVLEGDVNESTKHSRHALDGEAILRDEQGRELDPVNPGGTLHVDWATIAAAEAPTLAADTGMFQKFEGAPLTAYAFDRQFRGLGKWLVTLAAWLFAISTMISWSYYGEQGMIYMTGRAGVLPYKLAFLALIIVAAVGIENAAVMEPLMDLGTGAMLWANMPIVLMMGYIAVRELDTYARKLKAGEFHPHKAPSITDVVDGED